MKKNNLVKTFLVFSALFPFSVIAANIVDNAANEVSNAVESVGEAVSETGEKVGTVVSDSAITTAVKAKLALESDIPMGISVTTEKGVVYINGKVETRLQANRIVEIAQSVGGVKDVDIKKLSIASSDSYFDDAIISAKVKGKIMQLKEEGKIGPYYLSIETTNGEVHIYGTVANRSDISVIKDAASKIGGVKGVSTNIGLPEG